MSPSKSTRRGSHSLFFVQTQLSQQMILGHNFSKAYHIGIMWNTDGVMSLTRNGMPFVETLPTNDINALCFVWNLQPPHPTPMGISSVGCPGGKGKPYIVRSCVFEPSFKHRSLYSHCNTYERLVTVDDTITSSGVLKSL